MSVKMKPISTIKARLGIQKSGPAQAFFTQSCYRYMTPFVPGGTRSHLNQTAGVDIDNITYQGPDAHYLFNGILYVDQITGKGAFYSPDYGYWSRPSKYGIPKIPTERQLIYHTPGTGAHWDKLMWTSQGSKVVEEVQNYVNRGCK
jgi:lipoprotein